MHPCRRWVRAPSPEIGGGYGGISSSFDFLRPIPDGSGPRARGAGGRHRGVILIWAALWAARGR